MTQVLICGGAGFLGAWILQRLTAAGHAVRIFDRATDRRIVREIAGPIADQLEWIVGDITDTAAVIEAASGCDSIIHLAALLTPACKADPILGARVNVIGTLNVFEAARAQGIASITYASSAGVFGPDDGANPFPVTLYGAFKLACEGAARAYWLDAGIASIGFRPTIVYGPGREVGLTAGVTLACREAVAGRPYTIGFSGEQDFVYVEDAAQAFAAAAVARYEGAHAFSLIGSKHDAAAVAAEIRAQSPGAAIAVEGPPVPMAADIRPTPYEFLLGDMPGTSLSDGIARTIAHYRRHAGA